MGEMLSSVQRGIMPAPARARWFWYRQLKRPFFGRFMKPWRWPSGVPEQGWERLSIESRSHARLAAVLQRTPVQPARGVVVCAHPMGLACKGFWLRQGHAQTLLDAGFHVLAFDFNGFGESESTNFDWPADSVAVGHEARRLFPGLPVHALAASFGAMHTLNALGRDDFPYDRVVAEGCPATLPDFWRHYPLPHAVLAFSQLVVPQIERRLRPELTIQQLPPQVRLLLVHSQADRWTPVAQGDRLQRAAPQTAHVERLILTRADHTHGLRDERETYWTAVHHFLTAD